MGITERVLPQKKSSKGLTAGQMVDRDVLPYVFSLDSGFRYHINNSSSMSRG